MDTPHSAPTGRRSTRWLAILAIAALPGAVWAAGETAESQSPSYRLSPVAIDAAGDQVGGPTHRLSASLAQESTVGSSASPHFIVQSGFWSFLGTTMVPVLLSVSHTPGGDHESVDLSWSGNQASYDIYRSTDCAALFSSPLTATSDNDYTDANPPSSTLVCYTVLGEAPGPLTIPRKGEGHDRFDP